MKMVDFITEILEQYENYFPFEVNLKLKILKWKKQGKKLSEIKELIKKDCDELKEFYSSQKAEIELLSTKYLNGSDNKAISRITGKKAMERYSKIHSLVYFIGIDCFVLSTLKKFPFPSTVGFPYNEWSPETMHNYVRLYFHISNKETVRKKHNQNLPSLQTIRNSLNNHKTDYPKKVTLNEVLDYYVLDDYNKFYMLQFEEIKEFSSYIDMALIRQTPNAKKRLNLYIYDNNLNSYEPDSSGASDNSLTASFSKSFSASGEQPDLTPYFMLARDHCINTTKLGSYTHTPVFIINTEEIDINSYYKKLKHVPFMHFLLIDDFTKFKRFIKNLEKEVKEKIKKDEKPTSEELLYLKTFSQIITHFDEIEKKLS